MFIQSVCLWSHTQTKNAFGGLGEMWLHPVFVGRISLWECFCVTKYSVPLFFAGVTFLRSIWWLKLGRFISLSNLSNITYFFGQYQFFVTLTLSSFLLIYVFEVKGVEDYENNGNTDGLLGWHALRREVG